MTAHRDKAALLARATELESELREVRRQLAGTPSEALSGSTLPALHCVVGGHHCAVPVRHVDEVVPMAALTEVPESPAWVKGVLDVGGRLVPILDLASRLGGAPFEPSVDDSLVLCTVEGRRLGLAVSSVPTLRRLDVAAIASPSRDLAHAPFLLGVVRIDEIPVFVLAMVVLAMSSSLPLEDER